ncbi:cell wall-binding repeat-containing protein [Leifsonia xyli]|uniref:cell wall-binding repeat-containing protein n=1 Tax=Leifsonia xyli TaxID=1575 RepID=UPI003D67CF5C
MTVAALVAAGLAAGVAPASANPGTSTGAAAYKQAFMASMWDNIDDLVADSYSAQIFLSRSNGVDVLDEFTQQITHRIDFGGSGSMKLDADPTRSLVWVLDAGNNKLSRIDERTYTVTGSVTIPGDLRDLAVDHATGKVFVSTGSGGTVVPVDEATVAAGTAVTVGGQTGRIGVDPTAGVVFVTGSGSTVALVSEATGTVTASVPAPAGAVAIAVDPAHHKAYLGYAGVNAVTVIDGTSASATSIPIPSGWGLGVTSLGIDPTTQTVIGKNGNQLFRIDTDTGVARNWTDTGAGVTGPDISVDVFTNTVFFSAGLNLFAYWEPISFLGSASGVVPAGAPYKQKLNVWSLSLAFPMGVSVASGALPPGLSLVGDGSSGTITGTATTPGTYTFGLKATAPGGDSVTQTYTLRVVTVNRTAGSDRFATSVEVSKAAYPDPSAVGTVYVANGISFADALSGGPAAANDSGPLLLTAPNYSPRRSRRNSSGSTQPTSWSSAARTSSTLRCSALFRNSGLSRRPPSLASTAVTVSPPRRW